MSANPTPTIPVVSISGRVSAVDWYPRSKPVRFTTLVRLPAPDEFTTPQTVELQSDRKLGEEGEVITVKVEVGGRYRSYQATDKQTGEQRMVKTADNVLTVV